VEGVVQKLSSLGLEVSKSLADLSGKLVAEVEQLTTIREAVGLETREFERLQETVARQSAEIERTQAKLEEAKRQVQEIAVKAIEGASGAQALSQINKIAMEQAKTRAPQS